MSKTMCTDSNIDSNPILRNVTTPKEILSVFDAISYEKGAAVMKMLQYTLKDEFRKGLSNFLKKYAYKNADTKDLWTELTKATTANVNIYDLMDTWTQQIGFPYIELQRNGSQLKATQHWFLRVYTDISAERFAKNSKFNQEWIIPIVYKNLATGSEQTLWLNNKSATFEINAMRDDVLKFNPDFNGFYIVKYDENDWKNLGQRLQENYQDLSTTDRYNLLHDAFMLAENNKLPYDIPMQLTKYLVNEREAIPWNLFRDHFIYFIRKMDGHSETVTLLRKYVRNLTSNLYKELIWVPREKSYFQIRKTSPGSCSHTFTDLEFVPNIVDLACNSYNEKCLNVMFEELQQWMLGQNITIDLHFVFKVSLPHFGNETHWHFLYEAFMNNETSFEKRLLLVEGLVAFTDPVLIMKTIDVMMRQPDLEVSLIRALFQGLGNNPEALYLLWNYTTTHWDLVFKRLDGSSSPTSGISVFCDSFKTFPYLREFIEFVKQVPQIKDKDIIIQSCMEEIYGAVHWSDKFEETLKAWLIHNTIDV